jgi:hypothetical protein
MPGDSRDESHEIRRKSAIRLMICSRMGPACPDLNSSTEPGLLVPQGAKGVDA